ncbi:MAG: YihY/virulence factor BrkB family protein, partial [Actinomycetia bacterium]|nr:YihY/virulence factor BrkB family protein [Actinomycetes bacterium]
MARFSRLATVVREIRVESRHDHVTIVAAGIAFFAVLAVLPALFVALALYGLVTDPSEAERQIEAILEVFPGSAAEIIGIQMRSIAGVSQASLSFGFFVSLALFVWTVSNATRAVVRGVKIAY